MTVRCAVCDKVYAEKCPACGAQAANESVHVGEMTVYGPMFQCPACGLAFEKGSGGVSDGYCLPCYKYALEEVTTAA